MICPMCIANAALAVAGVTTSGGATATELRILGRKRGAKRKAEGGFPTSQPRRARSFIPIQPMGAGWIFWWEPITSSI